MLSFSCDALLSELFQNFFIYDNLFQIIILVWLLGFPAEELDDPGGSLQTQDIP